MIKHSKPLGIVLWSGPSQLDGEPIVAIATGFRRRSRNRKLGDMIQTWILRADVPPVTAMNTGEDYSVCGACPLRGFIADDGANRGRACYVRIDQAPRAVFLAYHNGSYEDYAPRIHNSLFRGRKLRIGSYGDPCAVPYRVWSQLTRLVDGWTGLHAPVAYASLLAISGARDGVLRSPPACHRSKGAWLAYVQSDGGS